MNACAAACMEEFKDIVIAYGQSDEYRCDHVRLRRSLLLW
jgi:tRNA(His) 5'-end guanylyltransferase